MPSVGPPARRGRSAPAARNNRKAARVDYALAEQIVTAAEKQWARRRKTGVADLNLVLRTHEAVLHGRGEEPDQDTTLYRFLVQLKLRPEARWSDKLAAARAEELAAPKRKARKGAKRPASARERADRRSALVAEEALAELESAPRVAPSRRADVGLWSYWRDWTGFVQLAKKLRRTANAERARFSPARPAGAAAAGAGSAEVATHNYEDFYGIPHGTVTLRHVQGSSAGVSGWSSSPPRGSKLPPATRRSPTPTAASLSATVERSLESELIRAAGGGGGPMLSPSGLAAVAASRSVRLDSTKRLETALSPELAHSMDAHIATEQRPGSSNLSRTSTTDLMSLVESENGSRDSTGGGASVSFSNTSPSAAVSRSPRDSVWDEQRRTIVAKAWRAWNDAMYATALESLELGSNAGSPSMDVGVAPAGSYSPPGALPRSSPRSSAVQTGMIVAEFTVADGKLGIVFGDRWPVVKKVDTGSAGARVAGLQAGCKLLTIGGMPVDNIPFTQAKALIAGRPLTLVFARQRVLIDLPAKPVLQIKEEDSGEWDNTFSAIRQAGVWRGPGRGVQFGASALLSKQRLRAASAPDAKRLVKRFEDASKS